MSPSVERKEDQLVLLALSAAVLAVSRSASDERLFPSDPCRRLPSCPLTSHRPAGERPSVGRGSGCLRRGGQLLRILVTCQGHDLHRVRTARPDAPRSGCSDPRGELLLCRTSLRHNAVRAYCRRSSQRRCPPSWFSPPKASSTWTRRSSSRRKRALSGVVTSAGNGRLTPGGSGRAVGDVLDAEVLLGGRRVGEAAVPAADFERVAPGTEVGVCLR